MSAAQAGAADGAAIIRAATAGRLGLVRAEIPERPHPLWLRAGTADAEDCIAALARYPAGLRVPYPAQRILEIGAGAGYRSVALAQRFPAAKIVATEPNPALQRINLLNTLPYPNITSICAPVGTAASRYGFSGRDAAGRPALAPQPDGPLPALPLASLLQSRGWESYDTVIITPDEAVMPLLQQAPWPTTVRLIAIRTGGWQLPGYILDHYQDSAFLNRTEDDYVLLFRREVAELPPPPAPLALFDPAGPPVSWQLRNVASEPWAWFPIPPHSFRLHPNPPGTPPAQLLVRHDMSGMTELHCRLRLGHAEASPVRFTIGILAVPDGDVHFQAERVVEAGAEQELLAQLPPLAGPCDIVFTTAMAEPAAENRLAWAEFLSPALR